MVLVEMFDMWDMNEYKVVIFFESEDESDELKPYGSCILSYLSSEF